MMKLKLLYTTAIQLACKVLQVRGKWHTSEEGGLILQVGLSKFDSIFSFNGKKEAFPILVNTCLLIKQWLSHTDITVN